jgi:hypothetical protein
MGPGASFRRPNAREDVKHGMAFKSGFSINIA